MGKIIKHEVIRAGKPAGFAEGVAVLDAKGFVFLSGCTGIDEKTGKTPPDLAVQVRTTWEKIIERLERVGSSAENMCHVWTCVVGSFPDGVSADPKRKIIADIRRQVMVEHYGEERAANIKVGETLIGVTALAQKEMLVEAQIIAAIL